jgi:putative transposase
MKNTKSLYDCDRFAVAVTSHAVGWYFRFQLSLRELKNYRSNAASSSATRLSAAGTSNSVRASYIALRLPAASQAIHRTSVQCSSRRAASLTCCGAPPTCPAPNSASYCRNVATRPQQRVSSNACVLPAPKRRAGSSSICCAVIQPPKQKSLSSPTSGMCSSKPPPRINNRAENSHQPTYEGERGMRGFRLPECTRAFQSCFGMIRQHFALKRHLIRSSLYRKQLAVRFAAWRSFIELAEKNRSVLAAKARPRCYHIFDLST